MADPIDLREWLADWPYHPDRNVRLVRARDGREVLQVRSPLGIEQYETEGRPDGERPQGAESLLDHQLARLEASPGQDEAASLQLTPEECAELFHEGTLYYYRYLHFFQLRDWNRTIRDTARNLRLFDFVHRHGAREEDRAYLEQWRPYILRIHAVAQAMQHLERDDHAAALDIARRAIKRIEALPELESETFQFEQERSVSALRELTAQIEETRPITELERLERQLEIAIHRQEFERAAMLRDRIRALRR